MVVNQSAERREVQALKGQDDIAKATANLLLRRQNYAGARSGLAAYLPLLVLAFVQDTNPWWIVGWGWAMVALLCLMTLFTQLFRGRSEPSGLSTSVFRGVGLCLGIIALAAMPFVYIYTLHTVWSLP